MEASAEAQLDEIQTIQIQMKEAQEIPRAIRSGDGGDLKVQGTQDEQFFTLKGASQPNEP
jgi:hypothetical protein